MDLQDIDFVIIKEQKPNIWISSWIVELFEWCVISSNKIQTWSQQNT